MVLNVLKRFVTPFPSLLLRLFGVKPLCVRGRLAALVLISMLAPILATMLAPQPAFAQGSRAFIRDAEIETIIRSFAVPLFAAAGLNPSSVSIRLVQDKALNAFVAGGQNIFIHTGLIIDSEGPDALIGVIAHETGHIEGGHLSRTRSAINDAGAIQLIGTLLGVVAGAAAGSSELGQAIIVGSQGAGQRTFMKYSRTQESAADQAAMRLLDATERSAVGLVGFLGQLSGQSALSTRLQDPYVQSHPLSSDRINALTHHVGESENSKKVASDAETLAHARMVAKLYGFIEPLNKVLRRYPETDKSFAARYARAIAYYRKPDLARAMGLIDALILEAPRDPYLYELKGQMLFEHARAAEALIAYRKAYQLAPGEDLIAVELARVELEMDDPALLDSAIKHFNAAVKLGGASSFIWRQLGIAYGRKGDMGLSALALAEAELRMGQLVNAEYQASRAQDLLPEGTSTHLQAQDILEAIKASRQARAGKK